MAKTILMYGRDAQLLQSRLLVLESRGFRVSPIYDLAHIDEALISKSFDLLVLCHTLTNDDCGRMLAVASTRWPRMKTLILTAGASGCHSKMMVEVFDILDGPSRLISTVTKMTETGSSPPIQTC